jgi:hypothetical protein
MTWDEFSAGLGASKASQELRRKRLLAGLAPVVWGIRDPDLDTRLKATVAARPGEETWWRNSASSAIWQGLNGRRTQGDFLDHLGAYIAIERISPQDWAEFWHLEVDADRVPANRITYLTEWYQWTKPIQFSNSLDAGHAPHMLTADVFLTADQDFWDVLVTVAEHFPSAGVPVLIQHVQTDPEKAFTVAITKARALLASRPISYSRIRTGHRSFHDEA